MAKQTVKSGLVARLGAKLAKAVEAHKGDETKFAGGGVDLPKGIENGIAQLVTCKFGVYEKGDFKGEYYFMASGIVVSPKKHGGIPIEGLRTSIGPEPICETPNKTRKTIEEHVAWVMNEMRKLGVDTSDLSGDDLEATAEALQGEKPHFRFRTWAGEKRKKGEAGYNEQYDGPDAPNPRVNHQWNGAVELDLSEEEESDEEVEDNTEEVEETVEETEESSEEQSLEDLALLADSGDEDAGATLNQTALDAGVEQESIDGTANWAEVVILIEEAQAAGGEEETEEETEGEEASEEEEIDLDALGASADEGDDEAGTKLRELAEEYGLDPDDSGTYPDWATLATAIGEAASAGEEGEEVAEEETEEEFTPAKGGVYLYKPKGAKKAIECEAIVVGGTTVTLKNLDDGKTLYKAVPHDQLSVG